MAKGGYRQGSGRRPGTPNKKTCAIRDRAMEEGITPLEVLLNDMRFFYKLGEDTLHKIDLEDPSEENYQLFKKACDFKAISRDCANSVAPYLHPRLQSITAKVDVSNHEAALAELE